MNNYHSLTEKFTFSPALEQLHADLLRRLKPNRIREDTKTGPEPDGKSPFLETFEQNPDLSYAECLAQAIVCSWMESPIVIYPGDLLLGAPRPERPLREHFSWGIQYHSHILNHPNYADRKDELSARIDKQSSRLFPLDHRHINDEGIRIFGSEDAYCALDSKLWWVGGYQGHTVPSYPKLLRLGIGGTLEEVRTYGAKTHDPKKSELYRALEILLLGFSAWVRLYADTADALAEKEADETIASGYRRAAANCRAIAENKPENLYEAAQLMYFYSLWDWVDCVGRIDQYLYPFYVHTVEEECRARAEDIVSALWLKFLEHGIHNVTLSGVHPEDGTDATNELTYLLLQISRRLHETHPRLSIRFHENSPKDLMALAVQMWAEGMSDPSVVSDTNVVDGLCAYGTPIEDARDYSMLGCQEIEIPGKSNFGCEDGSINLAKLFEYTINDGKCRITGQQVGLHTGYLTDYSSIEALWEAYTEQMRFFTRHFITLCNLGVDIRDANLSKLVKMPFTEACVERGLNPDGGGALYNYGVVETAGSSAVADAFAAIDKLVFREGKLSMETLRAALDANFEGYEKERLMLLNLAPKFGNDDDMVDAWHVRVLETFWTEIGKYRSRRGGVFTGACSLLEAGIAYGSNTWAMPDGRRAGEPLGNSIGPRTGADRCGATAMLNSVCKLPLKKGVGGTTLNVLLPKSLMQTAPLRDSIAAMMMTYLQNGGQMAQITTADLDAMLDAKKNPGDHQDLIVRIGGFSIKFIELRPEAQDEIIKRYA